VPIRECRESGTQEVSFGARPFILCGLPIRRLPSGTLTYTRRSGRCFLDIVEHPEFGVPFGRCREFQTNGSDARIRTARSTPRRSWRLTAPWENWLLRRSWGNSPGAVFWQTLRTAQTGAASNTAPTRPWAQGWLGRRELLSPVFVFRRGGHPQQPEMPGYSPAFQSLSTILRRSGLEPGFPLTVP
jgi:hypothetical protein